MRHFRHYALLWLAGVAYWGLLLTGGLYAWGPQKPLPEPAPQAEAYAGSQPLHIPSNMTLYMAIPEENIVYNNVIYAEQSPSISVHSSAREGTVIRNNMFFLSDTPEKPQGAPR